MFLGDGRHCALLCIELQISTALSVNCFILIDETRKELAGCLYDQPQSAGFARVPKTTGQSAELGYRSHGLFGVIRRSIRVPVDGRRASLVVC